ncbi:hypothetical protein, partial [Microbispora sp. NPDC046933]|uniref:hypothetical protein n=1 Tax=Microbispora sp. NPDC046933 TaxID=3155618 RepID=UPI0033F4BBBB
VPTTWDQLKAVSEKIKAKGVTPLAIGDTRDRDIRSLLSVSIIHPVTVYKTISYHSSLVVSA